MQGFNKIIRGYDPREVNNFIDEVIKETERRNSEKSALEKKIITLAEELKHYKALESTLNRSILVAQEAGDQIKGSAREESKFIVEDAKRNANRIVNEALVRAEKTEYETALLKKNIRVFKLRLRGIIESQLELVGDIDQVEI